MTKDVKPSALPKAEIGRRDTGEHFRTAFLAALAAIPIAGGPLAVLANEYLPDWKRRRVLNAIRALESRLAEMGDTIATDYIFSDEFGVDATLRN